MTRISYKYGTTKGRLALAWHYFYVGFCLLFGIHGSRPGPEGVELIITEDNEQISSNCWSEGA